ncbi:MAG: TonB-dependent receptor [Pseudomonadota bacterium]|nr:TonB-dependent receptor [Pseudomonadota bacterium]
MKRAIIFTLLTLYLSCSNSVFANQLEEIVITAERAEQTLSELSTNISIIARENLVRTDHAHLNEVLFRVSGAWISRGNGQEHLTSIRSPVLTGAGGCGAFLMAQDSIPLRATGFCNVNELFESHSEIAERIEVIKGPGTALHGSNAMHGLVNIITPSMTDPGSSSQFETGVHGYNRVKHQQQTRNWRVDASATRDGGYKDDSGFGQQKLTAKISNSVADFEVLTSISLSNLNQETSGFIKGDDAYANEAVKKSNPNPEAFRDARSARLYSRWSKVGDAGTSLTVTPYLRWTDMTFLQHYLPGQSMEENGHSSIGLQTSWKPGLNWLLGADFERTDGSLKQTQAEATQSGSAFLVATIPAGKHYDYQVTAMVAAVFGQYRWDLSNRSSFIFGARAETVSYDYENQMISGRTMDDGTPCGFGGCRFNRPESRSDSFSNVSPKLGFTHEISDEHQLYTQIGKGFRAPQATELYRLQNSQSVSAIDAEEIDSIEIGLRGGPETISYDLSWYRLNKDNFIFLDTNRANVDNGQTAHTGIDLRLHWQINDQASLAAAWTHAKHTYENNPALSSANLAGNDIDTAPRNMGSLQFNWLPTNHLSGELEWLYLGGYFTNPENTVKYPGHNLVNMRLQYEFSNKLLAFLRVTNLTDTDYAERADFAFGSERYFVGEPLGAYFGIRLTR